VPLLRPRENLQFAGQQINRSVTMANGPRCWPANRTEFAPPFCSWLPHFGQPLRPACERIGDQIGPRDNHVVFIWLPNLTSLFASPFRLSGPSAQRAARGGKQNGPLLLDFAQLKLYSQSVIHFRNSPALSVAFLFCLGRNVHGGLSAARSPICFCLLAAGGQPAGLSGTQTQTVGPTERPKRQSLGANWGQEVEKLEPKLIAAAAKVS